MNLQDIITYRETQGKESEFNSNIKDNNINSNINFKREYENKNILNVRSKKIEVNEIDNLNNDNKEDKNNSSNYSYTRSNMIEKEIENNLEHNIENNNIKINKNTQGNNQNNLNKNCKEENNEKNDFIDELIEKIRNKKDLGIKNEIPKINFDKLDEELKTGLNQLNKIQTKFNYRPFLNSSKNLEGNKKYKEIIYEMRRALNSEKYKTPQYKNGTYFSYKNMKIIKPSIYFQNKRKKIQSNKYIKKKENHFYLSSIDGKIIIEGERKNPDDKLEKIFKRIGNLTNKRNALSINFNGGRSYSVDKGNNYEKNKYFLDFGIRKVNYYNKNYFFEELNRINNLLFT